MNAQVSLLPDENIGVYLAANRDGASAALMALACFIMDVLVQEPPWIVPPTMPLLMDKISMRPSIPTLLNTISIQPSRSSINIPRDPVPLPLLPASYVNNYTHPFYGTITVMQDTPQTIAGMYGRCGKMNLIHQGNNTFVSTSFLMNCPAMVSTTLVTFQVNQAQKVDSFYAIIQSFMPPVVFTNSNWIPRGTGYPPP